MLGIGDPTVPKAPPAHLRTDLPTPPAQPSPQAQPVQQSQPADPATLPQVPVKMPPDHLLRAADLASA
eukprot:13627637-Alexandrium_andersonii.AAC.1